MPGTDQKGNTATSGASGSGSSREDTGMAYVENFVASVMFQPTLLSQLRQPAATACSYSE